MKGNCLISFLLLLIIASSTPSVAQLFSDKPLSPAKMCYVLGKKRTKKIKRKFQLVKQEKNITRINYFPNTDQINRASLRRDSGDPKEIFTVPELISSKAKKPASIQDLPNPINERHAEIRQIVREKISNGAANEPILESLYFITDEAEFAYVNYDPFLLAVEFALQGKMVLVEGHTDDRGADEHNLQLSMKRVRQIETLMLEIGVPDDNVSVIGYGESMPKYDNNTEEGRQQNRRVDFKIF